MSKLRVLVSGASIAGPTVAYWLAKIGADVTVIERFPQMRVGGQNVDIRTVGVTVMRKMAGMEAAVKAKRCQVEGFSFVNAQGQPFGTIRATGDPDQQSLVSEFEILRGDLAEILFRLTKDSPNIKYVFGEQISSIEQDEQDDGPVTVTFTNGLPTAQYDLVIACDGASSRTRALGLRSNFRDHMKSTGCWAAYFSIQQDILQGSKVGQAYCAPGGRFIAAGPDSVGTNQVTIMNVQPQFDENTTGLFRKAAEKGDAALREFIASQYETAGWECSRITHDMLQAKDFYATEIAQVHVPCLSKGRFVLVGDAGYAPGPTGTGTSLALAGAYVLAGEIQEHDGNVRAALEAYEARMRPLINELQRVPPFMSSFLAPSTEWGIWVRNMAFAFISRSKIMEFAQRFFASAFAHTDTYALPEYNL